MEEEFSIYKIYCQVNQKTYIGQTKCLERLWSQHKWLAKHTIKALVERFGFGKTTVRDMLLRNNIKL